LAATGYYSLHHRFRTGSGPIEPSIQWAAGFLSMGVERPMREAGHAPDRVPRSRMRRPINLLPHTPSWRGAQLKHTDKFNFTFYLTDSWYNMPRHRGKVALMGYWYNLYYAELTILPSIDCFAQNIETYCTSDSGQCSV